MVQVQTFGYDAAGNLASATDPDGSYTVTYDALDQPVEVVGPSGLTLDFSYDAGGDRTSAWDSAFGTETSEYDALGRLTSRKLLTADGQVWVDYTYTALDQVATVTRYADLAGTVPAGTTAYTYDDAGHLTAIQTRGGSGGLLADYSYTYDDAGRPASKTEGGVTTAFGYDDAGQVTADGSAAFSYDGAGNRTNTGYQTGDGNRLESDGTWAYTYDAAGELVKKSKGASAETWTYGYDHRGQMTWAEDRATDGGTLLARVEYAYDAFGNHIRRVEYDGSLAVVSDERYALDGWDTAKPGAVGAENFDVFADLDAAGTVTARRVFGPGFDEPVARLDPSGEVGWYGTDSQDSVRLIFDNTGTVTGSRDYTAFGAITAESGAGLDRYAYTAREWDAALGLQSNRQRMYDPATGRFTSEDPSGLSAGDVNLFRYAGNAVTTHTDPSGLDWWSDVRSFGQRMYDGNATFRGVYNGADKMAHGLGQIPLLMGDAIASGVGAATGRSVNYHSDYGRGLAQAQAEGRADQYARQAMVNALSLGTYGTVIDGLHAAQNYADTGDPTQLQEWSGELLFFAAAMTPLGRAKAKSCPVKKATTVETPISREPAVTVETPNEFGGLPPELFDPVDTGAPPPNVAPGNPGRVVLTSAAEEGRVGPVFDAAKLDKILANLEKQGVTVLRDPDTVRYLNSRGAGAMYLPEMDKPGILMLRPDARRLEVLEELFHHGQHVRASYKLPPEKMSLIQAQKEVEAQNALLKMAREKNWTQEEIDLLLRNQRHWEEQLRLVTGK